MGGGVVSRARVDTPAPASENPAALGASLITEPAMSAPIAPAAIAPASTMSASTGRRVSVGNASEFKAALADAQPGDSILLRAGTYDGGLFEASRSGRADAPITIRSDGTGPAILHGQLKVSGSHMRVEGLKIDGQHTLDTATLWLEGNASNLEIVGNEITGSGAVGSQGQDGAGIYADDTTQSVRIQNNWIHDAGSNPQFHHGMYLNGRNYVVSGNRVEGSAAFGIQLYPSLHDSVVTGNTVVRSGKSGIILGGEGSSPSSGVRIEGNTVSGSGEYGIATYWGGSPGAGNVISGNTVSGNSQGSYDGGAGSLAA